MKKNYRAGVALSIMACLQLSLAASEVDPKALQRAVESDPYLKGKVVVSPLLSTRTDRRSTYTCPMKVRIRGRFWGDRFRARSVVFQVNTAQVPSPNAIVSEDGECALREHEWGHVHHLDTLGDIVYKREGPYINKLYAGSAAVVSTLGVGVLLRRCRPVQALISASCAGAVAAYSATQGLKIKRAQIKREQEYKADAFMMKSNSPSIARGAIEQLSYGAVHGRLYDCFKNQEHGFVSTRIGALYAKHPSHSNRLKLVSHNCTVLDAAKQRELVQETLQKNVEPHIEELAQLYKMSPHEVREVVAHAKQECINSIVTT